LASGSFLMSLPCLLDHHISACLQYFSSFSRFGILFPSYLSLNMTPSPSPQSEFLEQKLESNLIESAVCQPSPFAIEKAFNPQERGSIVLSTGRATEKTNSEPSMSSDGKGNAASEDANLKSIWDDTMKEFGVRGKPHQDTSVLMISFADEFDDLHTKPEVDKLETVFKDLYHYRVIKRELSESGNQPPTQQLSRYLLELVEASYRDSTLLIVYYAGHGIPGKPGELHLAGYGT
jgi:hypothetical protein